VNVSGHSTSQDPDGSTVLTATGEIDQSNADTFAVALADATVAPGDGPVTVDLTAVEYLDSAALAALFSHAGRIRPARVRPGRRAG